LFFCIYGVKCRSWFKSKSKATFKRPPVRPRRTAPIPSANREAALISVADNLANALGFGSSGERLVSPQLTYAVDLLSLPNGIWDNLIPVIKNQIEATVQLF
jgi:hypothetical protein